MSVNETLTACRSNVKNPRFLIVNGEMFPWGCNAKGLGYCCDVNNMPFFTDDEIIAAVSAGKSFAIPTGKLSDGLFDAEFDPWRTLGSVDAAKEWLRENLWRLEKLDTIVLRSPQFGFHVLGFASFVYQNSTIDDWLWTLQADSPMVEGEPAIRPDAIHFDSKQRPHYAILPPSPGREWLTKCRTIKRFS